MGLDKWIKPEDTDKTPKKKKFTPKQDKKSINDQNKKAVKDRKSFKLVKYHLVCQNRKCKYRKTIVKKHIVEEDKNCPRCGKEMKIKEG
jgi:hypothetical protein